MRLETTRLCLRDWLQTDIDDLVEGLNDLTLSKWLAYIPHPYNSQHAQSWIDHCSSIQKQGQRSNYEFAVELKEEEKVIGGVSLARINLIHGTAGGGIWISSKYQGKGFGTEAFGERIRFAFEDLELRRLENGFFKGNESSFKMQQQFGYKLEGEKRQSYICMADGEPKDECITGLLKHEWRKI